MPPRAATDRTTQIKPHVDKWWSHARESGLLLPAQEADPNRSQSACGVSIDWLERFAESLKDFPFSTKTHAMVRDIMSHATEEQNCRLVDIMPQEHVGYPSYYICHSWNGDFLQLVALLVGDFNIRWKAYLGYRVGKGREWRYQDSEQDKDEESAALAAERKRLAGYFVWLDVAAVNQHTNTMFDPAPVVRIITAVGRTVLILDEEAQVLTRLWCLFELWTTIKNNKTISTLSLPRDNAPEQNSDDDEPDQEELRQLDVVGAKTTVPQDRNAILASFQQDLATQKFKVQSLGAIATQIRKAVMTATGCEADKQALIDRVYSALVLGSKVYKDIYVQPHFEEVDSVRKALREIIIEHYRKEASTAKMITKDDPELELWESMTFLEKEFEKSREEEFWVHETKRLSKLALHSYSSRFSNAYVNNLMRQAGTVDDMKMLAQYVHSQCRARDR